MHSAANLLYDSQSGCVEKNDTFPINRGVKQGDVLTPALFNAGLAVCLEDAMSAWKQRFGCHGVGVGLQQRLPNIRYADDLFIFAQREDELVYLLQILCAELGKVGLELNFPKRKCSVFTTLRFALDRKTMWDTHMLWFFRGGPHLQTHPPPPIQDPAKRAAQLQEM